MNYTQNERILQVSEQTLVIGVDVASEIHYVRCFNYRGIELAKVTKVTNDLEGFETFRDWISECKQRNRMDDVIIAMEPTGHYWFNIAWHFKHDDGVKVVLVNPFHVKRSKELDDNSPTKNDRKDPKTIAKLAIDGRYMIPYMPEGVYAELRNCMETRFRISKQLIGISNRIQRWFSIYFPEFSQVFSDWEGTGALLVLNNCPLPKQIVQLGVDGVNGLWRKEKLRAVGKKRAVLLMETAKKSIGTTQCPTAALTEMELLIAEYTLYRQQYDKLMHIIHTLIMQIDGVEEMLKLKGVGLITVAGFIAEIGDPTRFEHSKQIQKYAGLNIRENSSGKHKGKSAITKRGRKRLRSVLFNAIRPMIAQNDEFRRLHQHYTTRTENPLKKMQSITLLCNKLIRIFFAILTKGITYDPVKMMKDIRIAALDIAA